MTGTPDQCREARDTHKADRAPPVAGAGDAREAEPTARAAPGRGARRGCSKLSATQALPSERELNLLTAGTVAALGAAASTEICIPASAGELVGVAPLSLALQYLELPEAELAVLDYVLKGCTHTQLNLALGELVAQCQAMPADQCCTMARRFVMVGADPSQPALHDSHGSASALQVALAASDMQLVSLLVLESGPEMLSRCMCAVGDELISARDSEDHGRAAMLEKLIMELLSQLQVPLAWRDAINRSSPGSHETRHRCVRAVSAELLAWGCQHGEVGIIQELLGSGVEVSRRDDPGLISMVLQSSCPERAGRFHPQLHGNSAADVAHMSNDNILAEVMAENQIAPVRVPDELRSLLLAEQVEVVGGLLAAGADPSLPSARAAASTLPVQLAIDSEALALLQTLVSAGADVNACNFVHMLMCRLEAIQEQGSASWRFLVSAFDKLLEAGADVNTPGPDGYLPLDLALALGDSDIVWLLKLAGAQLDAGRPVHAVAAELYRQSASAGSDQVAPSEGWRAASPVMLVLDPSVDMGHPGSLARQQFASTVARDVSVALELPAHLVTVGRVKEPLSQLSFSNQLTSAEQQAAEGLYAVMDPDHKRRVDKHAMVALHGGDASGLFSKLDEQDGVVSPAQWNKFVVAIKVSRGEKVLSVFLRHLVRNSRALTARRTASRASALLSEQQRRTAQALFELLVEGETTLSKSELMAVFGGDPDGILTALGATQLGSPGSAPQFFDALRSDSNDRVLASDWIAFVASLKEQFGDKPTNLFLWQLNRNARAWGKSAPSSQAGRPAATRGLSSAQDDNARGFFKKFAVAAIDAVYKEDLVGVHGGDREGLLAGLVPGHDGTVCLSSWLDFLGTIKQRHGDAVLECMLEHLDRNATAELVWRGAGFSSEGRIAKIFDPNAGISPEDDGVVVELSVQGVDHLAGKGELHKLKCRLAEMARRKDSKLRAGRITCHVLPAATICQLVGPRISYLDDLTKMLCQMKAPVMQPEIASEPAEFSEQSTPTLIAASGIKPTLDVVHYLCPNDLLNVVNLLDFWADPTRSVMDDSLAEAVVLSGLSDLNSSDQDALSDDVLTKMIECAIVAGSLPVVQKLLSMGARAEGSLLHTALAQISQCPNKERKLISQALLDAGADPNAPLAGTKPLELALAEQADAQQMGRLLALPAEAASLVKSGANFSSADLSKTLEEFIAVGDSDPVRHRALEDTLASMVLRGVDFRLKVCSHARFGFKVALVQVQGLSLLDWALQLHSLPIIKAAYEAEKSTVNAFGKAGEHAEVFEPFVTLFLSLLDGEASPFAADFSQDSSTAQLDFAVAIAELFLQAGVAVLHMLLEHGSTPEGSCIAVLEAMAARHRMINLGLREARGERGTLLHLAARHNFPSLIQKIVELGRPHSAESGAFVGVSMEALDDAGRTPLMLAADSASHDAIAMLLDCGAHITVASVRLVAFHPDLGAASTTLVAERLIKQAVEDPAFDVSANMVWRQMPEHPQPKSNLRLEVAMVELSEVVAEVVMVLSDGPTHEARMRLEKVGEALVVSGSAVSIPILERAVACRAVALTAALARRADAADVWRVAIEALINLVSAVEASHDSRTRLEMLRAELAGELQRAEETLSGTRQQLAFEMLRDRREQLAKDVSSVPTFEDLEILGKLAEVAFQGATEPRLPSLRLADAEERLDRFMYEQAESEGRKTEVHRPGGSSTELRAGYFQPDKEWLMKAADLGSYPENPSEVDMAARYLATARLRRGAVVETLKVDILDLALRYSRLVYHYAINVYAPEQASTRLVDPENETAVTIAAASATELLRWVAKGCETADLDNCLLETVKRLIAGSDPAEIAFCRAAMTALLTEGADPTSVIDGLPPMALELALKAQDEQLLLELTLGSSPLVRLGCQQRAVDVLVTKLVQAHSGGEADALARLERLKEEQPEAHAAKDTAERALKRADFRAKDLSKSWKPSQIRVVAVQEALRQATEAYDAAKVKALRIDAELIEAQSVVDLKQGSAHLLETVLVHVIQRAKMQVDPATRPSAARRQHTALSGAAEAMRARGLGEFALTVFKDMSKDLAELGQPGAADGLQGQSLLRRACFEGEVELILSLLDRGVSASSTVGLLPAFITTTNERKNLASTPLIAAQIAEEQVNVVNRLIGSGANVNISDPNDGQEMLSIHSAIQSNNYELLNVLLTAGARVNNVSLLQLVLVRMLGTPRGFMQWEFLQDALDTLLKAGANVVEQGNVEQCGVRHYLPLDLACVLGDDDVVWLLKLGGASPRDNKGFPLHAVLSELYVASADRDSVHINPAIQMTHAKNVAKQIKGKAETLEREDSAQSKVIKGLKHKEAKGPKAGSWKKIQDVRGFSSLAPRMVSPPRKRSVRERPTALNLDVDASRMTILCIKMGKFAVGQRPSVPIGAISLADWHAQLKTVLTQAVEEEGLITVEFKIEPKTHQQHYPFSERYVKKEDKADPFEMRAIEIIHEAGTVVHYQGQVTTQHGAEAAARLLRKQRRRYLESMALQLINEGAGPDTPPDADHTVLVLAIMAGLADIAQKVVDMAGQKMNAEDTLALMSLAEAPTLSQITSADTDHIQDLIANAQVVDQLVANIVKDSNMTNKEYTTIMDKAIKIGTSRVVSALLPTGVRPSSSKGLHVALPGLVQAQDYGPLMATNNVPAQLSRTSTSVFQSSYWADQYLAIAEELLKHKEDANAKYNGKTPLSVVLEMDDDNHKLRAMAALIGNGASFEPSMFAEILGQYDKASLDSPASTELQNVLTKMIEQGVDYTLAKSRGKGLMEVAIQKGSLPIVHAVFQREQSRFEAATSEVERAVLIEPFIKLFLGLSLEEMDAFAVDLDQDNVATQSEFALALGDVLTRQGEPVLHLLFEHAQENGKDPEQVLNQLLSNLPDSAFSLDVSLIHGPQRNTFLHMAAQHGKINLVQTLARLAQSEGAVTVGFDLEAVDALGRTALRVAIDNDDSEMVSTLAKLGSQIEDELAIAATLSGSLLMLRVLLEAGCNPDAEGVFGWRPLHCCSQVANDEVGVQMATLLLGTRPAANVNAVDVDGSTPLTAALCAQKWELTDLLLSCGADPLLKDCHGVPPIAWAVRNGASDDVVARLADAVDPKRLTDDDMLIVTALEIGSDVLFGRCYAPSDGIGSKLKLCQNWPVMWWAAYFGREKRMRLTASNEAAKFVDLKQRSLLHWLGCWTNKKDSDSSWRAECVKIILAACNSDEERASLLHGVDSSGDSPLKLAVRCGAIAVAHALLVAMAGEGDAEAHDLVALAKEVGHAELGAMFSDPVGARGQPDATRWMRMRPTSTKEAFDNSAMMVDPEFPPNGVSLVGLGKPLRADRSNVQWYRAPEICSQPPVLMLNGPLDKNTIEPGAMSSPWFWCGVCSLSDETIRSFFNTTELALTGSYKLSIPSGRGDGQMVSVTIDDFIPCVNKRPAFGRMGNPTEVWPLLLCKAFAKLKGSFANLFELPATKDFEQLSSSLDQHDPILRRCHIAALLVS